MKRRSGSGRDMPCRATSIRQSCSPPGMSSPNAPLTSCAEGPRQRVMSSTSATACCRTRIRTCSPASSRWCTRRTSRDGRRDGEGLRNSAASWHLLPAYVSFLERAVTAALATVPTGSSVVFTAHSLPQRILDSGDPYPAQLRATADAVASALQLADYDVGWQSAGRTPEPWL